MTSRTLVHVAFTVMSVFTLTAASLPAAHAQEADDFLENIRAAANGKGDVADDGKGTGTVDDGKGDDGKGDDGKGKGKPPVTPQPPYVPSTGPESAMAVMTVVAAAYATWRYSKTSQTAFTAKA